MPIYEYQCEGCGQVFEVLQRYSDPAPAKHSCGSEKVHRIMSPTAFVFKGEGWYVTDYARKDKERKEKASKATSSESASTSSASPSSSSGSSASPSTKSAA